MADNPNVGPEPVEAEPNTRREKTYKKPETPASMKKELRDLPENEAQEKVREDMPAAIDAIKKKL